MELEGYLQSKRDSDPTWKQAHSLVQRYLNCSENLINIVRSGWIGSLNDESLIKMLGFTGANPNCLLSAAELERGKEPLSIKDVEMAVKMLGIRYSAVILAIHSATKSILAAKPQKGWKVLLENMMRDAEIGYKFGVRVFDIGLEGGVLAGAIPHLALGILLVSDEKKFRDWSAVVAKKPKEGGPLANDYFGCEPYQVTAMLLQQLGFGTDLALGIGIGVSNIGVKGMNLRPESEVWKAAYRWIVALRDGRDYPGELSVRNLFSEVRPKKTPSEKNLTLEVLYTEIAKVRRDGSSWVWHLPKPSYEETIALLGL